MAKKAPEVIEDQAEVIEEEVAAAEYVTLYRKYRPHRFSDLMGQDEVSDGVRNAIVSKRLPHALMLSGPRGCGKTTTARIIAAALNCPSVEQGEPCGICDVCVSIFEGNYIGVVNELNATDNRGIDDMRSLLSTVDLGTTGNYKVYVIDEALALDTPIPTPDGWTTMGDIKSGDMVLGKNGQPVRVVRATDIADDRPTYRVTFSDGTSIVADANHKWFAAPQRGETRNTFEERVITTQEMYAWKEGTKYFRGYGTKKFRLPLVEPVELPEASLPVDPYILGRWLGDGGAGAPNIMVRTEQLDELVAEIRSIGYSDAHPLECDLRNRTDGARITFSGNGFAGEMNKMGIYYDKAIPMVYRRGSIQQRMALVQGLMDSDGFTNGATCVFTNTNLELIEGLREILSTLGIRSSVQEYQDTRLNVHGEAYRKTYKLTFRAVAGLNPFRLRDAEYIEDGSYNLHRWIESVESIQSVPVRCIEVDSPDHLFLAGETMVPTHNCHGLTKEAASLLLKTLEEPPNNRIVFILATTDPHKVLDTIRSRATQFMFKLLNTEQLDGLVRKVIAAEGIELLDTQIANTVAAGRGSARDTLSALERVVMGIGGEEFGIFTQVIEALLDRNLGNAMVAVASADKEGTLDSRNIAEELVQFWRDVLVYQQSPTLLDATDEYTSLVAIGARLSQAKVVGNLEVMASSLASMRVAKSDRIALEGGLARTLIPLANADSIQGLATQVSDLSHKLGKMYEFFLNQGMTALSSVGGIGDWPETSGIQTVESEPVAESRPRRRRPTSAATETEEQPETVEPDEAPEPEQPTERPKRTSAKSAASNEESDGSDHPKWIEAIDQTRGRSRLMLDDAKVTYTTNGDQPEFKVTTERRLSERTQVAIQDIITVEFFTENQD